MLIIHTLNDFLFELFPEVKAFFNDMEELKNRLVNFYTFGPYRPKIGI